MAIIPRKTKDGISYTVRVRDHDGEWYPSASFRTKLRARDHEVELLRQRQKGTKAATRSNSERTVFEYWQEWRQKCRGSVSDGWNLSQDQMFRDHVMPVIGRYRLIDVTKMHIMDALNYATKKELGPQMHRHIFNLLHKMFADAVELFEYLDSSPVRKRMKPIVPKTLRNFLKPDDAVEFLDAVKDEYLGPAIWIMTTCGLRVGEMQALQWWQVDFQGGYITLSQQYSRKEKRIKQVKNGKPARIPMPESLVEYLSTKKIEKRPKHDDFVNPAMGGGMLNYDTFEDGLKRLCRKYDAPCVLTPHELRHTCTELWFEAGASKEDVRRVLNQRSESSINAYMHETTERVQKISKGVAHKGHLHLIKSDK